MLHLRKSRAAELSKVAEVIDRSQFLSKTFKKTWSPDKLSDVEKRLALSGLQVGNVKETIHGGLLTYLLHWLVPSIFVSF
jgi:hypothetical protein